MNNNKGLLLLDLDNTLWDFDGNAEEALAELFHRHELHIRSGFGVHHFIEEYKKVNKAYWKAYEAGEISKDLLRTARFTDTFRILGIPDEHHPENAWQEYLEICPVMTRMMPGTMIFLEEITRYFDIVLVTNGFEITQKTKVKCSGIEPYIHGLISSEAIGIPKPAPEIFHHAINEYRNSRGNPAALFYAGDTWDTDVAGGIKAGIKTCWYNHSGLTAPEDELVNHPLFCGTFSSLQEISTYLIANF